MLHGCRLHLPALGRALQLHLTPFTPSRVCAQLCPVHALYRAPGSLCCSSHGGSDGVSGNGTASAPSACQPSTPALQRHRQRRRGSLSPLERLSQLIPAELLSEEVADLTGKEHRESTSFTSSQRLSTATEHTLIEGTSQHQLPAEGQPSVGERHRDPLSTQPRLHGTRHSEIEGPNLTPNGLSKPPAAELQPSLDQQTVPSSEQLSVSEMCRTPQGKCQPPPPGAEAYPEPFKDKGHYLESPLVGQCPVFKIGDLCFAELRRKYYLEFKKMFTLKENSKLLSNWGVISHREITGTFPGQMLKTSLGFPLLFRRPSLEEFVLFMKRGPAVSYPKDSHAMLAMMDVTPGDTILEAGSGSGGMSLFLSRAEKLKYPRVRHLTNLYTPYVKAGIGLLVHQETHSPRGAASAAAGAAEGSTSKDLHLCGVPDWSTCST